MVRLKEDTQGAWGKIRGRVGGGGEGRGRGGEGRDMPVEVVGSVLYTQGWAEVVTHTRSHVSSFFTL